MVTFIFVPFHYQYGQDLYHLPHLGVCLDKVGETCLPKRKPKVVSHEVVLYSINGTQVKYYENSV